MSALIPFIAVALGGAIGAVLRYSVYKVVETDFPWATFIVNIAGCCLASFLMFRYGLAGMPDLWRTFIFVGIFGAFTTMSTFSIDTVKLMVNGTFFAVVFNIFINAGLCLIGAYLGRLAALL